MTVIFMTIFEHNVVMKLQPAFGQFHGSIRPNGGFRNKK
jgi:hypothetical protein